VLLPSGVVLSVEVFLLLCVAVVVFCRKEEGIGTGDKNLCKNKKAA
jgi:hypothetical protein